MDCLIANVALYTGASLLAYNRDVVAIATVVDLELDDASLTA